MNPETHGEPGAHENSGVQPYTNGHHNGHVPPEPYAGSAFAIQEPAYHSYGHAQAWHNGHMSETTEQSAPVMMGAPKPAEEAPMVVNQEQVDDMLRRHVLWLDTHGAEGKRVNFRSVDLRNVSLAGANLTQASLRGAILTGVDMTNVATMQEADFTEAVLNGANFSGTNLRRANFASVQAEGANFNGAHMTSANGLSANFTLASFRNTDMTHINLRQANMTAADFTETNLTEGNCRSANFSGARMHRTILVNADMRHTQCDGADFVETNLNQTQFKDATFDGVSFTKANFSLAVEISQHYQSAGFHQEKERIVQERQEVSAMSDIYTSYAEDDRKTVSRLLKVKRALKVLFMMWLVVLVGMIGITAITLFSIPMDQLRVGELVLLAGGLGFVTFMFLFTVMKTSSAINILTAHVAVRERQLMKAE